MYFIYILFGNNKSLPNKISYYSASIAFQYYKASRGNVDVMLVFAGV